MMLYVAAAMLAFGNPQRGKAIFDVHCATCHGLVLQGSVNAPPLLETPRAKVDFELRTGRMPAEGPREQRFDAKPYFTVREIGDVEAYIASKSAGDPRLPPDAAAASAAALRRGREVYEENCEQCHAATGHGDGATGYRDVAPSLMSSSPQIVADAVRTGPDVMPQFGPAALDNAQLADLIGYVRYLQTAQYNPGGLQLANLGPVPEGFIAWVAGIGLLVLFCRRIGEG